MLLCPSTMCLDLLNLKEEIRTLEDAGTDIFHNDIMDGCFVPNFALGLSDFRAIRACTDRPCDVHLMIENPGEKVDWFIDSGVDIIYIHPESERYVVRTLQHIRDRGVKAGIVINPDTSIETVKEMLNVCDYVMVMTVNPGFAGQKYIDFCTKKVEELGKMKEEYGFKLMIDGGCSPEKIELLKSKGADGFILGTSSLFGKGRPYKDIMEELRSL